MHKHREIIIDLTSLLDILLVLLYMFVINSANQTKQVLADQQASQTPAPAVVQEQLKSEIADAKKELENVKSEYDSINQKVQSQTILTKTCVVVTITVKYDEDGENRYLTVESDGLESAKIDFNWDNMTYAKNTLKETLLERNKDLKEIEQMHLFIFQYDQSDIFTSDFRMIDNVLKELQQDNDKVYLTYYDLDSKQAVAKTDKGTLEDPSETGVPAEDKPEATATQEPQNESAEATDSPTQ